MLNVCKPSSSQNIDNIIFSSSPLAQPYAVSGRPPASQTLSATRGECYLTLLQVSLRTATYSHPLRCECYLVLFQVGRWPARCSHPSTVSGTLGCLWLAGLAYLIFSSETNWQTQSVFSPNNCVELINIKVWSGIKKVFWSARSFFIL